jgi:hypothetical protein
VVDGRLQKAALLDHVGEHPELEARSGELATEAPGSEPGLGVRGLDDQVALGLEAVGHRAEQRCAPRTVASSELCERHAGSFTDGVHLCCGRLLAEDGPQLTGAGVDTPNVRHGFPSFAFCGSVSSGACRG